MSLQRSFSALMRKLFAYWLIPAGNRLSVYPDDTFLVSYPRSGNTWLRFLLGEALFEQEVTFANMEMLVPDIYRVSRAHLARLPRPRYIKSHEPYDSRYPKVIYLLRDPRDVAISYYHWLRKFRRLENEDLNAFIESFTAPITDSRVWYGGWGEHVRSWYQNRHAVPQGCLFVRYEDLLANPAETLTNILHFLGHPLTPSRVQEIVSHNTFKRMKAREQSDRQAPIFSETRQDIAFVRAGKAQQWREVFTAAQRSRFSVAFGDLMQQFGYRLDE